MLTIKNINNILYSDLTIHSRVWTITSAGESDNRKDQYHFYLSDGKDFKTVYLNRFWSSKPKNGNPLYKLHTSSNGVFVSNEELRSVGSTQYWLERVCE
jgi:hypothetical protein